MAGGPCSDAVRQLQLAATDSTELPNIEHSLPCNPAAAPFVAGAAAPLACPKCDTAFTLAVTEGTWGSLPVQRAARQLEGGGQAQLVANAVRAGARGAVI